MSIDVIFGFDPNESSKSSDFWSNERSFLPISRFRISKNIDKSSSFSFITFLYSTEAAIDAGNKIGEDGQSQNLNFSIIKLFKLKKDWKKETFEQKKYKKRVQ